MIFLRINLSNAAQFKQYEPKCDFASCSVKDAGQLCSPVREVATVVQYNTIAECDINGTQPAAPTNWHCKQREQILDKLYID